MEQLDDVLDRLTALAAGLQTPFNVTVEGHDGTSMDIVVGRHIASVQWVRQDPWD